MHLVPELRQKRHLCVYYGHYRNTLQAQNVDNWPCPDFRGVKFLAGFVLWDRILLLHLFWKGRRANCEQSWGYHYCSPHDLHVPWEPQLCVQNSLQRHPCWCDPARLSRTVPGITPGTCSWGELLELAVDIGSVNHSNTKPSVWFLNEEFYRQVSMEITTQTCIHRETGTRSHGSWDLLSLWCRRSSA